MKWFVRRLSVVVTMGAAMIATPGISSAQCDHNMSWNPTTNECKLPPAPPAWYTAPPAYSPSFAAQDVPPPPPPTPWWAPNTPMWSVGFHQWGVYLNGVWVPL
jgi:hypothetical protein